MNKVIAFVFFFFISTSFFAQEVTDVSGTILNSKTNLPLENVNIVNLSLIHI